MNKNKREYTFSLSCITTTKYRFKRQHQFSKESIPFASSIYKFSIIKKQKLKK